MLRIPSLHNIPDDHLSDISKMKFGQEYQQALLNEDFPAHWRESAIEYKNLKKCIKKIHNELVALGLDATTLSHLSEWEEVQQQQEQKTQSSAPRTNGVHKANGNGNGRAYYSASSPGLAAVSEEFTPQLRVLVDGTTGVPLDATLTPETRDSLRKLARHEMVTAGRRENLGASSSEPSPTQQDHSEAEEGDTALRNPSAATHHDARWVQVPLTSAKDFFDMLEPKLEELEALREAETRKLEEQILDLGDLVEDVVEPVREGFEARREVSHRDLYFWREMFRLYMEKPIFYSETEARRGAFTFLEAKSRLIEYDQQIRSTGLLAKMKTPQARKAAQQFLDLNVEILKTMHFQEMNARAMTKILKKFDKRTHLEGQYFLQTLKAKYPEFLPSTKTAALAYRNPANSTPKSPSGFANSIARDLNAELTTKILSIVPQLDDWTCPVCYGMAWRPVSLRCCKSVFCIRCIIHLQDEGMKRCPVCNQETVLSADGRNLDFETMDFMQKYFPLEVKRRQRENEKMALVREFGEGADKRGCRVM